MSDYTTTGRAQIIASALRMVIVGLVVFAVLESIPLAAIWALIALVLPIVINRQRYISSDGGEA